MEACGHWEYVSVGSDLELFYRSTELSVILFKSNLWDKCETLTWVVYS